MDPLIGLLRHKDGNVCCLAAGLFTSGDLGPAARRAVPALIAALATAETEADRDMFRPAVERVGKYDVSGVFAAVRAGTLTDVDLGNVTESLCPDDDHAVAGLTGRPLPV